MSRSYWLLGVVFLSCQLVSGAMGGLEAAADEAARKRVLTGPSAEEVEVTLRRELAYGLTLFDGAQYQAAFCPKEIDVIYLRADVDNVIMASATDVYYWPLTKEYMADWLGVNEKQPGFLEIRRGGKVFTIVAPCKYALRYPEGPLGRATELVLAERAETEAKSYKERITAYYEAMEKYRREYERYQELLEEQAKRGGRIPDEPIKPTPLSDYIMEPNEGFIVNLPPGTYQMVFKDPDGRVVPDSDKKLISFPALATGTGYDILPEDRWTMVTESNDRSQSIFALGNQVLYLQPYTQEQYNAFYHLKLKQLSIPTSGRGMRRQKTWVHLAPLTGDLTLEILKGRKILDRVMAKSYYVKQRPGYALGYEILEFDAEDFPEEEPTFSAFRVEMPKETGRYSLRLVDRNGVVLPGSQRDLRTISRIGSIELILAAFFPLLIGLAVVGRRAVSGRRVRRALQKAGGCENT